MASALRRRLAKLEAHRDRARTHNRILRYRPPERASLAAAAALRGRVAIVPDFGTDADWERAAIRQQVALVRAAQQSA